ncbi:MAG: peptidase M14, partial [Planctomycetia bacterium]|nr:peptidase M14 [Planctomycetia bacterium]
MPSTPPPRPRSPGRLVRRGLLVPVAWLAVVGPWAPGGSRAGDVPSPESHLGFRPGADSRLAPWGDVVTYFEKVDRASDRVRVRVLGESTEGRPLLAAFVSSPETVKDLDRYRGLQARLSDPRTTPDADARRRAVAESKPVVVITCSIHSTETASTLMAMELLHDLATRDDPRTLETLDKTILILVPSANPDGVDKVARWYDRTRGHPW